MMILPEQKKLQKGPWDIPLHRSLGATPTLGSAHIQKREGMCWPDCWDPRSQGDSVNLLTDTVWVQGPTREMNLFYVKVEKKIKDSNLSKSWKTFIPKIYWQHDGTLNHDSLVAISYCSIYLFYWHATCFLGIPNPQTQNQEAQD